MFAFICKSLHGELSCGVEPSICIIIIYYFYYIYFIIYIILYLSSKHGVKKGNIPVLYLFYNYL